jgi:ribonuclease BN (tRNA processing enzyme)
MKLTFAGVGSAFTDQRYYQSNMVITAQSGKRLLIDCGSDARFSLAELGATNKNIGEWIDGVYISHLHADHIGGLEWLGFCTYFNPKAPKPKLFIVDALIDELWDSLKGGMRSHEGKVLRLDSFFEVHAIPINNQFDWEDIWFTPVQTVHIMDGFRIVPSYGLMFYEFTAPPDAASWTMRERGPIAFLTTDTQFCPRQIERFYDMAEIVFHDAETSDHKSGVHAHYYDLCTLPAEQKKKMWLYHYGPDPKQKPEEDGFMGFVKKGQTFEL